MAQHQLAVINPAMEFRWVGLGLRPRDGPSRLARDMKTQEVDEQGEVTDTTSRTILEWTPLWLPSPLSALVSLMRLLSSGRPFRRERRPRR